MEHLHPRKHNNPWKGFCWMGFVKDPIFLDRDSIADLLLLEISFNSLCCSKCRRGFFKAMWHIVQIISCCLCWINMVPERHSHCTIECSSPSKRNEFSTSSEISSLLLQEGKKESIIRWSWTKKKLKRKKLLDFNSRQIIDLLLLTSGGFIWIFDGVLWMNMRSHGRLVIGLLWAKMTFKISLLFHEFMNQKWSKERKRKTKKKKKEKKKKRKVMRNQTFSSFSTLITSSPFANLNPLFALILNCGTWFLAWESGVCPLICFLQSMWSQKKGG